MDSNTARQRGPAWHYRCRCGECFPGPSALYKHFNRVHARALDIEAEGRRTYDHGEREDLLELVAEGVSIIEAADAVGMVFGTACSYVAQAGGATALRRKAAAA